jgi:pyruvate dehydrogenase E2 component (dihydrolipoamide acetyltransferase)
MSTSIEIEMPRLSSDGESATLASWLVSVGDQVEQGEVIAELETDKSTVELEAPSSGTILELSVAAGTEDIEPGTILGTLDASDESLTGATVPVPQATAPASASTPGSDAIGDPPGTSGNIPDIPDIPAGPSSAVTTAGSESLAHMSEAGSPPGEVARRSTPLARRAASARGVDLESIAGSGPGGRVIESDVLGAMEAAGQRPDRETTEAAANSQAAAGPPLFLEEGVDGEGYTTVRLSAMRKTIARRLAESKREVPHFYLRIRCPMDAVVEVRARLNEGLANEGRDVKISVNDFILRAAALAMRDVPEANVQFAGDTMRAFDRVDVSIAVATDGGLVTPVVRDADRKGLTELAQEVRDLASQAREGSLVPEQYQGGTLTISNLGMYGVETVYPILNPPQACILGVGAAEEQPVVRGGEIVVGRIAALTLAADHRAVDGAVGARLLAALRARLEDPLGMML